MTATKSSTRRTKISIDETIYDLADTYAQFDTPPITYRTYWQRIKRLAKNEMLHVGMLRQAAYMPETEWITFFGGGRHRGFVYAGEAYPSLFGQAFRSVTAFLRAVERYEERATIWARLKRGWTLDDALLEPVLPFDERPGMIYLISSTKMTRQYVGLTRMSLAQRWHHHVRVALENNAQTALAEAIRAYGVDSFTIAILEEGVTQDELPAREIYWMQTLNTLAPHGLNVRAGGAMAAGSGRKVLYQDEAFASMAVAVATLSQRTGLAPHVIERRIRMGQGLPRRARAMSKHPEAGTNLWRRWKSLLNSVKAGRREGPISPAWQNYDAFAADVRSGYRPELRLVRIEDTVPWGRENFRWVTTRERQLLQAKKRQRMDSFGRSEQISLF